jgi:hypothetical protein
MTVHVDLEVEVAADGDRVAGLPHRADALADVDALATVDQSWARHVGVEVGAVLAFAVDQQVVAVEDRVVARLQHLSVSYGYKGRAAGGDDVEALMGAAAAAGRPEFADVATGTVRAVDREDVVVVGEAAVAGDDAGVGRCDEGREKEKSQSERALQWCSITRSTSLYSFASSALMK